MVPDQVLIAGEPDQVQAFSERRRTFVDGMSALETAINDVFTRDIKSVDIADAVIFYLGRRCVDDFLEIVLLCANGYGPGASSLLRGMYERAVTAAYLHLQPDEAGDFAEYDIVRKRKLAIAIKSDGDAPQELIEQFDDLDKEFQRVRERFVVTDCVKCGTQRLNHSWSKLDFVSMSRKAGLIGRLIVPAYYMPLDHAHSTLASITSRLTEEDGVLSRLPEANVDEVDMVLQTAHGVLLLVLQNQLDHFGNDDGSINIDELAPGYYKAWGMEPTG